jgi:hypothetical protein
MGLPRLSHQFPVDEVVAVTVVAEVVDVVGITEVVDVVAITEVVVEVGGTVVDVVVVVELPQDASSSETTIKKLKPMTIILLFILPPF